MKCSHLVVFANDSETVVHLAECKKEEIPVLLQKVLGLRPWNDIARPVHCLRVVILYYLHRDSVKIKIKPAMIPWRLLWYCCECGIDTVVVGLTMVSTNSLLFVHDTMVVITGINKQLFSCASGSSSSQNTYPWG